MEEMTDSQISEGNTQTLEDLKEMKNPKEVKYFERGDAEFTVTTFKLQVEQMIKNQAWQKNEYMPRLWEHCHVFHDHDRRGKKQTKCSPTGGHFHEMITKDENGALLVDENGHLNPKVGPPQKMKFLKNGRGKMVKQAVPIEFYDGTRGEEIVDKHTHKIENLGSEVLSQSRIRASQQEAKKAFQALHPESAKK